MNFIDLGTKHTIEQQMFPKRKKLETKYEDPDMI